LCGLSSEGHELMYSATGAITTHLGAPLTTEYKFLGELKFLVR
jgi:hypothetical protein